MKTILIAVVVLFTASLGATCGVLLTTKIYNDRKYGQLYVEAKRKADMRQVQVDLLLAKLSEQRHAFEVLVNSLPILEPRPIIVEKKIPTKRKTKTKEKKDGV